MDQNQLRTIESRCTQEAMPHCAAACPFHLDIRSFMTAMADGKNADARKVLERHLPLPGILTRICDHPCESHCLRRDLGGSLAISLLEQSCMSQTESRSKLPRTPKSTRCAVLGNGLAGLTVAAELSRKAFPVTVYWNTEQEKSSLEDCLLRSFPELDRECVHTELENLKKAGVHFIGFTQLSEAVKETCDALFVDADAVRNWPESWIPSCLTHETDSSQNSENQNHGSNTTKISANILPDTVSNTLPNILPNTSSNILPDEKQKNHGQCVNEIFQLNQEIADAILPVFAPETASKDEEDFQESKKTGICMGGFLSHTPTGCLYASASRQADEGHRAAVTLERMMTGVSLTASREGEGQTKSRLFTPLEGIDPVSRIIPSNKNPEKNGAQYSPEEACREAARCIRCECLVCVKECVFLQKFRGYPRTYARQIYNNSAIVKGLHLSNTMVNSCALCGQCTEICPERFSMAELCLSARQDMVERGFMPPSAHEFALEDMESSMDSAIYAKADGSLILTSTEKFEKDSEAKSPKKADLFFPGCQLAAARGGQVLAVYDFLVQYTPDTAIFSACCGVPALWAGEKEKFSRHIQELRSKWEEFGRPRIITACASCLKTFREFLPDAESVSLWEILDTLPLPQTKRPLPPLLTIADPCAARNDANWQKAVRSLARKAGITIEEPKRTAQETACCGYGGLVWNANPELADNMARSRAQALPHAILASCIMCRDRFAAESAKKYAADHAADYATNDAAKHAAQYSAEHSAACPGAKHSTELPAGCPGAKHSAELPADHPAADRSANPLAEHKECWHLLDILPFASSAPESSPQSGTSADSTKNSRDFGTSADSTKNFNAFANSADYTKTSPLPVNSTDYTKNSAQFGNPVDSVENSGAHVAAESPASFSAYSPLEKGPGISARRFGRAALRSALLRRLGHETPPAAESRVIISEEVLELIERKHILRQDVEEAIAGIETENAWFLDRESGHIVGSWRPRNVNFWVRCSRKEEKYILHDAWCHRMIVPGADAPHKKRALILGQMNYGGRKA